MRIEIKQTNWSDYRKKGILTLNDFNRFDKAFFIEELVKQWARVIFYDPTNPKNKNENDYSNILYWEQLKKGSKQNYSKHAIKLTNINKQGKNIQDQISNLIINKIISLQDYTKKRCELTGIDISIQKDNSLLLSHSGLYHLIENTPIEFDRIKSIFLSKKWQSHSLTIQVKEIAHNIRNRYYNKNKRSKLQMPYFSNCHKFQNRTPLSRTYLVELELILIT